MKHSRWPVVAVIFSILIASGCASVRERRADALNAYVDDARSAGLLNGNILVADHGKVLLRRAVGYADGSGALPLKLTDRFDIGSIAKEFDAVGILMLAEDGKLSLTDPVSHFVPSLPAWSDTVTIDELLHYTSGLPDIDWNTVETDADNLRNLKALDRLDFPAGNHYAYNNNNTFLRRRIIEKASGMSFTAFLEARVFPKAGLRDAVVDPTDATFRVAKGLDGAGKQEAMKVYLTGWTALTVDDLYRWSECITHFCLITPASTRQIVATGSASKQSGLGHVQMASDRVARHVHDGNDHQFEALLMAEPPKGGTIILTTSQNRNDVYAMAEAINAILDGQPYQSLRAATKPRE